MTWSRCRVARSALIASIPLIFMFSGIAGAQGVYPPGHESPFVPSNGSGSVSPLSFLPFGNFRSSCDNSGSIPSLGILGAGYNYRNFTQVGVRFDELRLMYTLPLLLDSGDAVRPYVLAYITDLKESPRTRGIADALLRLGGAWRRELQPGSWLGARGELTGTRRLGKWNSGGQVGIEAIQCFGGGNASVRITYYAQSVTNQLIGRRKASGYEVAFWYARDLLAYGPCLMVMASGYEFGLGQQDAKQRGWELGASLRFAGGLFSLKGTAGHDSVLLDNYSLGAFCTLAF